MIEDVAERDVLPEKIAEKCPANLSPTFVISLDFMLKVERDIYLS